jgi:hypothetical protein
MKSSAELVKSVAEKRKTNVETTGSKWCTGRTPEQISHVTG